MKQLYEGQKLFFSELGFRDGGDFFSTVFGFKGMLAAVSLQWVVAFFAALIAFTQKWIWPEAVAFWGLMLLIILDSHYGYLVARKLKGESFLLSKFWRTVSMLIAHTSQLVIIHMITTDYAFFSYVGQFVFLSLFIHKLNSLWSHYKMLQLQSADLNESLKDALANWLRKFIGDKLAAGAVQKIEIPEEEKEKVNA